MLGKLVVLFLIPLKHLALPSTHRAENLLLAPFIRVSALYDTYVLGSMYNLAIRCMQMAFAERQIASNRLVFPIPLFPQKQFIFEEKETSACCMFL